MDFEKKYWSSDEFITSNGDNYTGYVGIYEGNAYNFESEELLKPNDTYVCRINCSEANYDRTLSHELKLPYEKKDILFGANDFLYSSTLRTAVERLEANNNYIFQNSIISNSNIPNADYCMMLASKGGSNAGKLYKYNFSDKAFDTKTAQDPTFYEKTIYEESFSSTDTLGVKEEMLSESTAFIKTPEKRLNLTKYNSISGKTAKEVWKALYGDSDDSFPILKTDDNIASAIYNKIDSWKKYLTGAMSALDDVCQNEYFYQGIKEKASYKNLTSNDNTFMVALDDNRINNVYSIALDKTSKNLFHIILTEIHFIVVTSDISKLKVFTNGSQNNVNYYKMSNKNHYLIKVPVDISCRESGGIFQFRLQVTGCEKIITNSAGKIQLNYRYIMTVGMPGKPITENYIYNYRFLPKIQKQTVYQYVWALNKETNTTVSHSAKEVGTVNSNSVLAPAAYTYKHLKESINWINAPQPGLLSIYTQNGDNLMDYIPEDSMTAEDTFIFMQNNACSYKSFPAIRKTTVYTFANQSDEEFTYTDNNDTRVVYIENQKYKKKTYNIKSYSIDEKTYDIVDSYKYASDVYNELNLEEGEDILPWEYIPVVEKSKSLIKEPSTTNGTNGVFHNFNEITAANIVVKSVDKSTNCLNLLLFLTFKNKFIIFPIDYYVNKETSEGLNTNGGLVVDLAAQAVNNINNGSTNYIEVQNINPTDKTSLKFLNLNAIKIHKKMMYLVDNKLNMVLRYDIEGLFETSIDSTITSPPIKLLNMLQGSGDSTDKIYFNEPYSVDANDDRVYIADRGNKCVKVYTPGLNYLKTLKNGFFSGHDIQAVAINPCGCIVNGKKVKPNSLWIATSNHNRIYLSILSEDIVIDYGQIEDISLQQDKYTWVEEIKGIVFSKSNSNYFYINTNKRAYKLHTSKPYYPFATMSYFNQRSLVNIMKWRTMNYPWHKLPAIYTSISDTTNNEITWKYRPPAVAAELLDNKCFALTNVENFDIKVEGDIIFHFGVLYDNSKIMEFIKTNSSTYSKEMTFNDISSTELSNMIKSAAILVYQEPDGYISSLSNNELKIYDTYEYSEKGEEDYINALTFNKMLYAMVFNLLRLKNNLMGTFKAATNIDSVIVYDNLIIDDYFNNLQINNDSDYFIHDNELTTIIVNRTLENIYNLQKKILARMQTTFMATQSWVNNVSRII